MALSFRRDVLLGATALLLSACGSGKTLTGTPGSGGLGASGGNGGTGGEGGVVQLAIPGKANNDLDLLFMVDGASGTTSMQAKFLIQVPAFMRALQSFPNGLPNLHLAVVSSDMGAPGDSTTSIGCMTEGDNGQFHAEPRGTCAATTLSAGATFLSDVDGQANFTDPIDKVFQCIALLGSSGCGFEHQLASIDRALGADGAAPPATNAGFLRPDAYLGIILLTNEDDCSAPPDTSIYSLNGQPQSIINADGPIAKYRCNGGPRGGHLCKDPSTGQMVVPPLNPPADATGNPPILNLTSCQDNQTGSSALTAIDTFVRDVKGLKADPDNQILVAAITAPPAPYAVEWIPPSSPPSGTAGQLWPRVMDSCGAAGGDGVNPMQTQATTDGTFGDPAVRITQFVNGFPNSVLASVCSPSYATTLLAVAAKLGTLMQNQSCVTGTIQTDSQGYPACTVTTHVLDSAGNASDVQVPDCNENGQAAPCWTLTPGACTTGGALFKLTPDEVIQNAASVNSTLKCSLCQAGTAMPGC